MNPLLMLLAALTLPLLPRASTVAQCIGSLAHDLNLNVQASAANLQEVDYAQHFRVFTGDGEPVSLQDVVRAMAQADAVLVGESHTDPVGHWVQIQLLREALAANRAADQSGALRRLALSLEMFERDVQDIVDEYLQDLITEEQFKSSARPWEYYDFDYRPIVELAKEAGIPVIAANAPRRYVNRVTRLGRDALNELPTRARDFLPPLPYPQPTAAYREEWLALMAEMPMERQCEVPAAEAQGAGAGAGHAAVDPPRVERPVHPPEESPAGEAPSHRAAFMENGLQAQALWDASMAHAITTFLDQNPGALVLHMVGGFHVENHTGIPEQVQHYRPGTRSLVVSMEIADDFRSFDPAEHTGRGDFVILTDKSLDQEYARYCAPQESGGE